MYTKQNQIQQNQIYKYAKTILRNEYTRVHPKLRNDLEYIFSGGAVYIPNGCCSTEDRTWMNALCTELKSYSGEFVQWSKHLKHENPDFSPTFKLVIDKLSELFNVDILATRLNYYPDGKAWKPFHHDSHAYQTGTNIKEDFTMGVSFGSSRKLAFKHPDTEEIFEFPQHNGDIFAFDSEVNQRFMHGVPKVKNDSLHIGPRISIIAWGKRRESEPIQNQPTVQNQTQIPTRNTLKERIQKGGRVQSGWALLK